MICKKCGTQLDDNAVYCYNCGYIFEKPRQPQQPVYEQNSQWNYNNIPSQEPPKNNKALWYKVFIPVTAVLVIIAIVCGIYVGGAFKGNDWQVEVPDVVGLQFDKADSKLENKTLHCLISDKVADTSEENSVVSQDPSAETVAGKGSIVDVVISSGAEKIYLPELANCSLNYVESMLKDRGLNYEQKTAKGDYDMYAPNAVCYYSGEEGTPFTKDETVVIYVKAETEKESAKISLPALVKMDFDEAQDKLYKDGVYIAVSGYEYNENISENKIINQSVKENSQVEKGSTVYVTVSLGKEKIYMPDVTLMTLENAKKTLEAEGIKVKVEEEESKVIAKGTVVNQNTNPGTRVDKGFEVILTVSSGYTVTVPDIAGLSEKEAVKKLLEADLAVNVEYVETEGKGVIEQSLKADEKTQIGTVVTLKVSGKSNGGSIGQGNNSKENNKDKSQSTGKDINFGNVVKVDGKVYYWKYNSSSFENKSVYQNYTALNSTNNQLICRDSTGKENVVIEAPGAGNLSLVGDRFFYNVKDNSDYGMATYTCKIEGSDTKLLDSGELMAVTADNKYVVCNSNGIIKVYDVSNLNNVSEKKFDSFVACGDNKIIGVDNTSVVSYDPDGSNEATLYSSNSSSMAIIHPYIDNGYIYFATGSYSGSGGFFDGGKIIKAKLDGTDTKSAGEGNEFSKEFTVDSDGNVHVDSHYSGESDHTQGKNMIEPYVENYSIGLYDKEKNDFDFVVTQNDYFDVTGRKLGYDNSDGADHSLDPYFVQKVDDKVYFLLHKGIHTSGDFVPGGRYQYTREKSYFFEKDLKSGKTTLLYEF